MEYLWEEFFSDIKNIEDVHVALDIIIEKIENFNFERFLVKIKKVNKYNEKDIEKFEKFKNDFIENLEKLRDWFRFEIDKNENDMNVNDVNIRNKNEIIDCWLKFDSFCLTGKLEKEDISFRIYCSCDEFNVLE